MLDLMPYRGAVTELGHGTYAANVGPHRLEVWNVGDEAAGYLRWDGYVIPLFGHVTNGRAVLDGQARLYGRYYLVAFRGTDTGRSFEGALTARSSGREAAVSQSVELERVPPDQVVLEHEYDKQSSPVGAIRLRWDKAPGPVKWALGGLAAAYLGDRLLKLTKGK